MTGGNSESAGKRKYPRTPHLPFSEGATSDDKWMSPSGLAHLRSGIDLVVTEKKSPVHHALTLRPVIDELHARGYIVYAVDNVPAFAPAPVWDVSFPDRSAFLFGEERSGLSPEAVEECDRSVFIPMNGIAPRSLNVGHAAAIIIGEYARQHRFGMGS